MQLEDRVDQLGSELWLLKESLYEIKAKVGMVLDGQTRLYTLFENLSNRQQEVETKLLIKDEVAKKSAPLREFLANHWFSILSVSSVATLGLLEIGKHLNRLGLL